MRLKIRIHQILNVIHEVKNELKQVHFSFILHKKCSENDGTKWAKIVLKNSKVPIKVRPNLAPKKSVICYFKTDQNVEKIGH